jgi:Spy/CpxP family protein refolding chaperone
MKYLIALLILTGVARAESDPIATRLFPPELIMSNQAALAIDDKQRDAILKEVEKTQAAVLPLQWQMQGATAEMAKLLDAPKIDEAKVLAQAGKVMEMEQKVKRIHLTLLVRLRNLLTDAQRAKLQELQTRR